MLDVMTRVMKLPSGNGKCLVSSEGDVEFRGELVCQCGGNLFGRTGPEVTDTGAERVPRF